MTHDRSSLLVECRACPVQGVACGGCMITALLDPQAAGVESTEAGEGLTLDLPLDRAERQAVGRLVAAGLVSVETANLARARQEPWSRWEQAHETG